jgi:hypothetical protein
MEQERALFQKRVSPEIDYINAKEILMLLKLVQMS